MVGKGNRINKKFTYLTFKLERWVFERGILSPKWLCLPDFLGIGGQKCGTTWLFSNLANHPEIFIPEFTPHYDLHYFDKYFHKSLVAYSRKFKLGCKESLLKGENTPAYGVMSEKRIKFLRHLKPTMKILLLVRHPVERAWSHAWMGLVKRTGRDFEEIDEKEFFNHFNSERSKQRGHFSRIIEKWQKFYPEEQLFIGAFSKIKNQPKNLLKRIFKFLEVNEPEDINKFPYRKKINKGQKVQMPEKFREHLLNMYKQEIDILAKKKLL